MAAGRSCGGSFDEITEHCYLASVQRYTQTTNTTATGSNDPRTYSIQEIKLCGRKNDVYSKCKTKLTGLGLPGIMYVDKIFPEINSNSNIKCNYRDTFAYFRQSLICGNILEWDVKQQTNKHN